MFNRHDSMLQRSTIGQALQTIAACPNPHERSGFMRQTYAYNLTALEKAVSAISSEDINTSTSTSAEFLENVIPDSALMELAPFAQRADFNEPYCDPVTMEANFVREGHAIEVSDASLGVHYTRANKVAVLAVYNNELIANPNAYRAILAGAQVAATKTMDQQLLDANADDIEGPTPITKDAESFASSGDPVRDVKDLAQNPRNVATTFIVAHPETALRMNLTAVDGAYPFPDLGWTGGTAGGIRVITSPNVPQDSTGSSLIFIDPSRMLVTLGGFRASLSTSASVQFSEAMDSNGEPAELVSLFQTHGTALLLTFAVDWKLFDSGAVRVCTGVDY